MSLGTVVRFWLADTETWCLDRTDAGRGDRTIDKTWKEMMDSQLKNYYNSTCSKGVHDERSVAMWTWFCSIHLMARNSYPRPTNRNLERSVRIPYLCAQENLTRK